MPAKKPDCLYCGKPLARYTHWVWFHTDRDINDRSVCTGPELPKTKAEAQRYTNHPIVHVKQNYKGGGIVRVSTWDGVSYGLWGENQFCTKECGFKFGCAVATEYMKKKREEDDKKKNQAG